MAKKRKGGYGAVLNIDMDALKFIPHLSYKRRWWHLRKRIDTLSISVDFSPDPNNEAEIGVAARVYPFSRNRLCLLISGLVVFMFTWFAAKGPDPFLLLATVPTGILFGHILSVCTMIGDKTEIEELVFDPNLMKLVDHIGLPYRIVGVSKCNHDIAKFLEQRIADKVNNPSA